MVVERYFDIKRSELTKALAKVLRQAPQDTTDMSLQVVLDSEVFPKELKDKAIAGYKIFERILSIAGKNMVEFRMGRFHFAMNEYGNAKVVVRHHNHYDKEKDTIAPLDVPTFRLETRGKLNQQSKLK